MAPAPRERSDIRALARGLKVLEAMRALGRATLHDLHGVTGLPKTTLVRILTTLEHEGYVWRGLGDSLYRLSSRIEELSGPIGISDVVAEIAAPFIDQLSSRVGWPSDIAVYEDGAMTIGETTRRRTPLIINRLVTAPRVHMLMSSLGRTYLAFCPKAECEAILDRLRKSSDSYDRIARDDQLVGELLATIRTQGYGLREPGYSVTKPEEDEFAVRLQSIAVPVRAGNRLFACISLVWIADALSDQDVLRAYLAPLQRAAADIAQALDGNAPLLKRTQPEARSS